MSFFLHKSSQEVLFIFFNRYLGESLDCIGASVGPLRQTSQKSWKGSKLPTSTNKNQSMLCKYFKASKQKGLFH